jgi:hypothetical protein
VAEESLDEKDHVVELGAAREDAILALARRTQLELADSQPWRETTLDEPALVRDVNGQLLFYDFPLRHNNDISGHIRMAANELIGTPDVAVETGPRPWDLNAAVEVFRTKIGPDFPEPSSTEPLLVCYSYPKLGFMVETSTGQTAIYDLVTLDPIERSKDDKNDGAFAWSFFDSLSIEERARRLSRYRLYESARADRFDAAKAVKQRVRKTLQYCTHYDPGETGAHHCFSLHGQQVSDYCAVATCQMILCYYRYYRLQSEIAPELGYTAGNGCPKDHSRGYETLTSDHLDASYDGAPTWEKARDQIDALRPFKAGVRNHARACVGYSSDVWVTSAGEITERKLYVRDPSPTDRDLKLGGLSYWETWDAIQHTNYVTVQIRA